jgi:hypothetical protein
MTDTSNTPAHFYGSGATPRSENDDSEAWRLIAEHLNAFDAFVAIDDSDEHLNQSSLEEIRAAIGARLRMKSSFERMREALAKRDEKRKEG